MKKQLFFYNFLILKNIFLKKVTVNALPLNFLVRNYVDKNKNLFLIDNFSTFFNFKILKKKKLKPFIKKKNKLNLKTKSLNLFNLINYLNLKKKRNTLTNYSSQWKKLLKQTNTKYASSELTRQHRIETKKKFEQQLFEQDRIFFLKKIQKNDIQKITSYSLLKKVKLLLPSFLSELEIKKIFDNKLLEKGMLKPLAFLNENEFNKLQQWLDTPTSRITGDSAITVKAINSNIHQNAATKSPLSLLPIKKKLQKQYSFLTKKKNNIGAIPNKMHVIKQHSVGDFIALNPISFFNKNNFNFSFNFYQKFFSFKKIQYLKTVISSIENLKNSSKKNKDVILSNKNVKGYTKAYLNGLLFSVKITTVKKKKKLPLKAQILLQPTIFCPIGQKDGNLSLKLKTPKTVYIPLLKTIPFFFKKICITNLYLQTKKSKITDVLETFSIEKKINENKILNFKLYTSQQKTFLKKKKKSKVYPIKKKKKILKKTK